MSKAFTRESDDLPDRPLPRRQPSLLPPGAKNYTTVNGARVLREERDRLKDAERQEAETASESQSGASVASLRQRIADIDATLRSAVIVEAPPPPWDQVRFGATVTVRDANGSESRFRIVGVDETDVDRDWVSWCSPIARALLNARIGERVRFRAPGGEQMLEIIGITYE
jgi:transcription elongation factor GreB